MNEIERITDELQRALYGETWHGPSLTDALTDVTAAQAAAKPLPSAHSIWEIVLHLTFWAETVGRRLDSAAPVTVAEGSADWPGIGSTAGDATEDAWHQAVSRLEDAHRELSRQLAALPEAKLAEAVPGKGYDAYVMLHGLAQHDAYHAGQIALLKKATS